MIEAQYLHKLQTKESIIRNGLSALTKVLQHPSVATNLAFPEIILFAQLVLKNFHKQVESIKFSKIVGNYLD